MVDNKLLLQVCSELGVLCTIGSAVNKAKERGARIEQSEDAVWIVEKNGKKAQLVTTKQAQTLTLNLAKGLEKISTGKTNGKMRRTLASTFVNGGAGR